MLYHKQTILHDPDNGKYGDCYRTCIACLLDLKPIDVPHFCDANRPGGEVVTLTNEWLASRELTSMTFGISCELDLLFRCMAVWNPGKLYMLTGMSPRQSLHVVIAKDDKIIHDPHPEGGGIIGPDKHETYWIDILAGISHAR